jgi:acyl transferase domain-containing protein
VQSVDLAASASGPRPVVLLLPGQGSQQQGMAAGLYGWNELFTEAMTEVFDGLGRSGPQIRHDWLSDHPRVPVSHVTRAQPLLFALDYALGRLAMSWGIPVAGVLGHSVGELAGAVLTGVLTLTDAITVLSDRVQRLAEMPAGGMLAVAASPAEVTRFLRADVVVGAVNAPRQVILAGSAQPLAETGSELVAAGFTCQEVDATTAFHSPAVQAAVSTEAFEQVRLRPPSIPLWSGYTAAQLTAEQACTPEFWARHPVDPVLFGPALDALLGAAPGFFLLECGPGRALSGLARRHRAVRAGRSATAAMLPAAPRGPGADRDSVSAARDALLAEGHDCPTVGTGYLGFSPVDDVMSERA